MNHHDLRIIDRGEIPSMPKLLQTITNPGLVRESARYLRKHDGGIIQYTKAFDECGNLIEVLYFPKEERTSIGLGADNTCMYPDGWLTAMAIKVLQLPQETL